MSFTYEYPRPSVTVDCIILGFDAEDEILRVLLIKRADEPFKGMWAIPGGFVETSDSDGQGESIDEAARRELREETGITVAYLEQLYTFGTPGRDPRGRVITVAYLALVRQQDYEPTAGSDAAEAQWFAVEDALSFGKLAFDHRDILSLALKRVQGKVRYSPLGFNLLPQKFTMGQLQKLYEALLLRKLNPSNFSKKIQKVLGSTGILVKTKDFQKGQHRPAPLYRFDKRAYDKAVRERFNFEI
jgi:8-oxo-dGTP diphosphatase